MLDEYEAGNTTTRNDIVAILYELRNRYDIGEEECRKCNNWLNKDSVKYIIEFTSNFIISHDKKELL